MKGVEFVFGIVLLFVCCLLVFGFKNKKDRKIKNQDTTNIIVTDVTKLHVDHNKKEHDDLQIVKEVHDKHHVHCADRCKICKSEGYGQCDGICSLCFAKK